MFKIREQEATGPAGGSCFTNPALISPRISFSHDFADTIRPELGSYKEAPVSTEFEFSVNNNAMIPADQIFFKGMLVPSIEDMKPRSTLRDQLLAGDDDEDVSSPVDVLSGWSGRWIERWGLKKSNHHQYVSKKGGKRGSSLDGMPLETVVEEKASNASKEQQGSAIECCDDASRLAG